MAALFVAVGFAGMPLEPLRILAAMVMCAIPIAFGRFLAPGAMVAVLAGGFIQHGGFRVTLLVGAVAIGAFARYAEGRPKIATGLMASSALVSTGLLLFG